MLCALLAGSLLHCTASLCLAPSLQDYLETKRIAFPRFYFVAPADLLDILSKGSNPQAIIRWDGRVEAEQGNPGPACTVAAR